jgi:hypothetical protein
LILFAHCLPPVPVFLISQYLASSLSQAELFLPIKNYYLGLPKFYFSNAKFSGGRKLPEGDFQAL